MTEGWRPDAAVTMFTWSLDRLGIAYARLSQAEAPTSPRWAFHAPCVSDPSLPLPARRRLGRMAAQSGEVMRPHKLGDVLRLSLLRLKGLRLQWNRSCARGYCLRGSRIGELSRQCTVNSFARFARSIRSY